MAKKKKTNTVDYLSGYIPADFNPIVTQATIKQIPPYEDAGVKFQGYSKKLIKDGEYQLFPQQRFFMQDNASNTLSDQTLFIIPANRTLYVSSIWFSGTVGTSTDAWDLQDGSLLLARFQNFANHQEQIIFDPPLKFNHSVQWDMQQTGTQLYLNVFGWLE